MKAENVWIISLGNSYTGESNRPALNRANLITINVPFVSILKARIVFPSA